MYEVHTVYTPGLAQNGYVLISAGEAAVIDPRRDTDEYHEILQKSGAALKFIFETHSHADFVTGGPQLARETGEPLCLSEMVNPDVPHQAVSDGQAFELGSVRITAIHTPGHTPEHLAYFVEDLEGAQPPCLFSGDLMFVGDLGRPELLGDDLAEELAPKLYDSVFRKIGTLPPETVLYPGHGAGSLCGKSLSEEPTSTLAKEFATSPALQITDKDEFVRYMLSGQPRAPTNFARLARVNRAGAPLRREIEMAEIGVEEVERALGEANCLVLDIRVQEEFSERHIPGSIFLGMDASMPTWLGWLIAPNTSIILVANCVKNALEYAKWMQRIGYDEVIGCLKGGIEAWESSGRATRSVATVSPANVSRSECVYDVRTPSEYAGGTVAGAKSVPLCEIPERMVEISKESVPTLMCLSGYRGTIASSLLLRAGYERVENVEGGFAAVASQEATGATP